MRKKVRKNNLSSLLMFILASLLIFSSMSFINIKTVQAETIRINKSKATLIKGQCLKLKLNGTKLKPKWSSSNKSVATVAADGKVIAKKRGNVVITAKINKKKYTCKLLVESPSLNKKSVSLKEGKSTTIKIIGTKQKIIWKSSNNKVATVKNGKITAIKSGTANITATVLKKKYSCKVTVVKNSSIVFPNQRECGDGIFYIYFASGSSEYGRVPEVYVNQEFPFGYVDYCAYGVDNSVPIHVYIDGKQIDVSYVGYRLQRSMSFSGNEMKKGIHTVEMIQYENNNPKGKVITYRKAQYKVLCK